MAEGEPCRCVCEKCLDRTFQDLAQVYHVHLGVEDGWSLAPVTHLAPDRVEVSDCNTESDTEGSGCTASGAGWCVYLRALAGKCRGCNFEYVFS